ncbi:hypothetical protein H3T83_11000 [Gilliamella sp. M0320]|uniref:hypothetical protein n=1 Tax=Gilliamella sp. M0320 TaxID=2750965 RepID=UPI0018DDFAA3|nr:hypothetical protein [Gilliamella sp. M0320]MBI0061720.1 hypothetical protein [Gilliamella sp. M0320]
MVFILTVVVLQSISFTNYALTTKTTNIIYGSAPYLTFDGGRTRVTNTEALLGISLSDGRTFTPTTNNSSDNPIILPVIGQSFNDIGMLVPRNTNSIALSSLIGTPYNYWGDDDGDGQGVNGVTATGSLNLSIVDKNNQVVARNEVLTICKAPYKLTLSNGEGTLTTRYGVPNESRFTVGNATYYINPKAAPAICYARPNLRFGNREQVRVNYDRSGWFNFAGPADIWNPDKGFLTQSATPSSYDLNFPTTGANNLYFDLDISGSTQALSWAPVSHGGITATMTDSTSTSVRVTLTGPAVTDPNQWESANPGRIARPSLPQTFELVGRDSSGNAVVKYGFELKQWFVNRGSIATTYPDNFYDTPVENTLTSWCSRIGGYRVPKVKELTNAVCGGMNTSECSGGGRRTRPVGAKPSSGANYFMRRIGGGLFSEWGVMFDYTGANFVGHNEYYYRECYETSDKGDKLLDNRHYDRFYVNGYDGSIAMHYLQTPGVCVYP